MCVDNDSRPPIHPIAGGSADARDLYLTSSDGTKFMAHAARAASPTGAGMVVIPDVRGLHPYYKELADRFSEVGVDAVAIDFFARTAPSEDRSDKFDFMSQVPLTKPDQLQADIAAAVAHLKSPAGGGARADLLGRLLLRRRAVLSPGRERPRLRGRHRLLRLAARPQALAGPAPAHRRRVALRVPRPVPVRRRRRGHPAAGTSTSSTPPSRRPT